MKHEFKVRVYPADTDSYGVVWHGAYLKWLERGRVDVLEQMGIMFPELDRMGILMPIVKLDIDYKKFARPYDELAIESEITETKRSSLAFKQTIININTGETILSAHVIGVTTSLEGKLNRTIPEYILDKLN